MNEISFCKILNLLQRPDSASTAAFTHPLLSNTQEWKWIWVLWLGDVLSYLRHPGSSISLGEMMAMFGQEENGASSPGAWDSCRKCRVNFGSGLSELEIINSEMLQLSGKKVEQQLNTAWRKHLFPLTRRDSPGGSFATWQKRASLLEMPRKHCLKWKSQQFGRFLFMQTVWGISGSRQQRLV